MTESPEPELQDVTHAELDERCPYDRGHWCDCKPCGCCGLPSWQRSIHDLVLGIVLIPLGLAFITVILGGGMAILSGSFFVGNFALLGVIGYVIRWLTGTI